MTEVSKAFESSKIVPEVIPKAPTATIDLKYPSGAKASQGNELTPTQVKDQPTVTYEADPNSYYTLVFTDPDNYDGPEKVYREWHHWLVVNIPGNNVSAGETLSGYIGSGPPEGTGIHRYVYILYQQPGKLDFDEPRLTNKSIDGRASFSTNEFAKKYNLGAPVAGNFYRAQFDSYVPLLYKSLGLKYPSGAKASQGNELTPTQVKDQPTVTYEADPNSYYTLVFTDPDNYDGPEKVYREWHHWLVVNIPGNNVSAGETLSGYIGSGPPEGTGIHRYVYILYQQPGKLDFDEPRLTNKSIDGRASFSTNEFAKKYNLGAPVAGNFYRAQFDSYVPLLYKSLGV